MIRKSIQISPILALQRLFLSCQEVFKGHGTVPSPNDVQKLCHILGELLKGHIIFACLLPLIRLLSIIILIGDLWF